MDFHKSINKLTNAQTLCYANKRILTYMCIHARVSVSTNSAWSICKLSLTQRDAHIYHICMCRCAYIWVLWELEARNPLSRSLVVGCVRYICACRCVCSHAIVCVCDCIFTCLPYAVAGDMWHLQPLPPPPSPPPPTHTASVRFVTFSLFCCCPFFFFQLTVSKVCNAFRIHFYIFFSLRF